ncbi:MAG: NAD-dependent epimerase/dehydratase family protein [Bacteroidota bacterium]
MPERNRILVIGAGGQLGQELVRTLVAVFGEDAVVASDIDPKRGMYLPNCHFEPLNVFATERMASVIRKYQIKQIYHLAAILSADGEVDPHASWQVNLDGLLLVLDTAKRMHVEKVFWPSSIAVFGGNTEKKRTRQHTVIQPNTVYGIAKASGELWCRYYHQRYGLDVRSLRYPGLIGHSCLPSGGTTDYAVDIFHHAVREKDYVCYLDRDTHLPMMYMPDAVSAALKLMQAPQRRISIRTSYNVGAMSFSPEEVYHSIKRFYPNFKVGYRADHRQEIAESWPLSVDDTRARADWGHSPKYDLDYMTEDMLDHLARPPKVSLNI